LRMAKRFSIQQKTEGVEIWIMDMEQLLSGNTESSSTGTHGLTEHHIQAWCSFCSTRSSEQLQWSIMESESTYIRQLC